MRKTYILAGCLFVGILIWMLSIYQGSSPVKDGLYLKYEIAKQGVENKGQSDFMFTQADDGNYLVQMNTVGLFEQQSKDKVDRNFLSKEGLILAGPIGGIIWIDPNVMRIGEAVPGGKVVAQKKWQGYDVYVVEYVDFENCCGYYDKKSGLQVGFSNHWSLEKLDAVLVDTNAKLCRTD